MLIRSVNVMLDRHEAVFGEVCFDVQLTVGVEFTATDALLEGKTKGRLTRAKHNISPPSIFLVKWFFCYTPYAHYRQRALYTLLSCTNRQLATASICSINIIILGDRTAVPYVQYGPNKYGPQRTLRLHGKSSYLSHRIYTFDRDIPYWYEAWRFIV